MSPPMQDIEPIQEIWSFVKGPDERGVLFDANSIEAGETQPRMNNSGWICGF